MIRLSRERTKTLLAIHGWSGILLGLLLYTVILTGVVAVFADEIGDWASPLAAQDAKPMPPGLDARLRELAETVDPQYRHDLSLWPRAGERIQVFFHDHVPVQGKAFPQDIGVEFDLHPQTLAVLDRREGFGEAINELDVPNALSDFLVELHVSLHLPEPWGLLVTGILGLAMLVAALTGLVVHRHLVKELFTVRRWRDDLLARRDVHAIAGTWNLPFAFILAFTGSYFSFAGSVGIPVMAGVAFGGDQVAMFETLIGNPPPEDDQPMPITNLDAVLADAQARAGMPPAFVSIEHWGRADALITVFTRPAEGRLLSQNLIYDGASGAFQHQKPGLGRVPSLGGIAIDLMGPLHFGNFAGLLSKAAWFALGFASCYVTLTGMQLWILRRSDARPWQRMARAVTWTGYGLPLALALTAWGYFIGHATGLSELELPMTTAFIGTAALCLIPALAFDDSARQRRWLLRGCGLALLLLPILRYACGGPGWIASLELHQTTVPAFDLALLLAGGLSLKATFGRGRDRAPGCSRPAREAVVHAGTSAT